MATKEYRDMSPAERVEWEVKNGRLDEIGDMLLMHLAHYGTDGIDAQALAQRVWERIDEG
jgi:hypothetical protein